MGLGWTQIYNTFSSAHSGVFSVMLGILFCDE
jgi:hypothetical protein